LAAAAALSTVQTIVEDDLVARAAHVGAVLLDELRALQEKYRFVGDVRGAGLFIGMDLVRDRRSKEPLANEVTEWVFLQALRRGLLFMGYFSRVRINPPLVLTESEARDGVAILDEVFSELEHSGRYRT
jgi:4-aminobutyrate aminotransferase-like enzyme